MVRKDLADAATAAQLQSPRPIKRRGEAAVKARAAAAAAAAAVTFDCGKTPTR